MPYLILIAGLLLGLYGLYRFFLNASPAQAKAGLLTAGTVAAAAVLLLLAATGRLAAALGLFALLVPALLPWLRRRLGGTKSKAGEAPPPGTTPGPMNRAEALAVLGLGEEELTDDAVREAHRKLIMKLHPDQEGSVWLAAKINQARDFLLGGK